MFSENVLYIMNSLLYVVLVFIIVYLWHGFDYAAIKECILRDTILNQFWEIFVNKTLNGNIWVTSAIQQIDCVLSPLFSKRYRLFLIGWID